MRSRPTCAAGHCALRLGEVRPAVWLGEASSLWLGAAAPRTRTAGARTQEPWAYALQLGEGAAGLAFDESPSHGWSVRNPFADSEYPFSIRAPARRLGNASWGYWAGCIGGHLGSRCPRLVHRGLTPACSRTGRTSLRSRRPRPSSARRRRRAASAARRRGCGSCRLVAPTSGSASSRGLARTRA